MDRTCEWVGQKKQTWDEVIKTERTKREYRKTEIGENYRKNWLQLRRKALFPANSSNKWNKEQGVRSIEVTGGTEWQRRTATRAKITKGERGKKLVIRVIALLAHTNTNSLRVPTTDPCVTRRNCFMVGSRRLWKTCEQAPPTGDKIETR